MDATLLRKRLDELLETLLEYEKQIDMLKERNATLEHQVDTLELELTKV